MQFYHFIAINLQEMDPAYFIIVIFLTFFFINMQIKHKKGNIKQDAIKMTSCLKCTY